MEDKERERVGEKIIPSVAKDNGKYTERETEWERE